MARPNWEYVRVDVLLPDNPKLDGLSAAAKWTLIELWCYCGQHLTDGFVRDAKWPKFGSKRDREALVTAGLIEPADGGWQVHDYTGPDGHQRSRAEVLDLKEKRRKAGEKGGRAKASATAEAKQTPEHVPKQTAGKSVAEAEAEAEADKTPVAEPHDHLSGGNLPRDDVIDSVIGEIHQVTGRIVKPEWAAGIAASLLQGRDPADPAAYVRAAIRNERDPAARFLPVASSHPSARTATEAAFAAGIQPGQRPADDRTIASFAAQARQAITRESA